MCWRSFADLLTGSEYERAQRGAIVQAPLFGQAETGCVITVTHALLLTYGARMPHAAVHGGNIMSFAMGFLVLGAFCIRLFALSLRNINRKWIV